VKLLLREGWALVRITGSHHYMAKGTNKVSVPVHGNHSLGKGLEAKILKKAGLKK
jgi:predicted RNA binding protein YcfA (HicA-like mRNA interferase family)